MSVADFEFVKDVLKLYFLLYIWKLIYFGVFLNVIELSLIFVTTINLGSIYTVISMQIVWICKAILQPK